MTKLPSAPFLGGKIDFLDENLFLANWDGATIELCSSEADAKLAIWRRFAQEINEIVSISSGLTAVQKLAQLRILGNHLPIKDHNLIRWKILLRDIERELDDEKITALQKLVNLGKFLSPNYLQSVIMENIPGL